MKQVLEPKIILSPAEWDPWKAA